MDRNEGMRLHYNTAQLDYDNLAEGLTYKVIGVRGICASVTIPCDAGRPERGRPTPILSVSGGRYDDGRVRVCLPSIVITMLQESRSYVGRHLCYSY